MDYLIAPTLFKNKTCRLPGIGTLNVIDKCAETDYVGQKISAPQPSIVFSAPQENEDMFNEFTALSEFIRKDLDEKGSVSLKGIGEFVKDEHGAINFNPLTLNKYFFPSVDAKQKIEEGKLNDVSSLAKESITQTELPDFLNTNQTQKSNWWVWAIGLALVGLSVIGYYIFKHGFNSMSNVVNYKIFDQILQY